MGVLPALGLLVLAALISAEGPYVFHGKFRGKCEMGKDGLYYRDERTFAVCSHGNAYVQPCPAGTKNAEYNDFFHGKKYHYNQFCDVNLVDQTITTHAQVYGSYRPLRLGNRHGGTQSTGATYGTSIRQHGHRSSGYEYTGTSYERDNKQTGGLSNDGTYQRTNTGQQHQRPPYGSAPMSLEETYNTFFNAAGFHGRIPLGVSTGYRFRAYPRYT